MALDRRILHLTDEAECLVRQELQMHCEALVSLPAGLMSAMTVHLRFDAPVNDSQARELAGLANAIVGEFCFSAAVSVGPDRLSVRIARGPS